MYSVCENQDDISQAEHIRDIWVIRTFLVIRNSVHVTFHDPSNGMGNFRSQNYQTYEASYGHLSAQLICIIVTLLLCKH